ncbi:MAG TPA: nuclear transport factor 2 family protein [Thermoanaerobaculia bacterium]|nr:nuclear transport factor 2 family protein [Thermoanaerobaculia bacterium]
MFRVLAVMLFIGLEAHAESADAVQLKRLLTKFLDGASRSDAAMHQRFWADDLIYTSSAGKRMGKADILRGLSQPHRQQEGPSTLYTAEDVRVQLYGTTAIVAFRLVATTRADARTEVANYLNTGTFVKRRGEWRAVAWQATKIPPPEQSIDNHRER